MLIWWALLQQQVCQCLKMIFFQKPIHLWRALIAWFGGGLIWIAAFVILLPASRGGFDVFSNKKKNSNLKENSHLNERSMTLNKISKKLIPIYIGLTFILWCLLTSLWDRWLYKFNKSFFYIVYIWNFWT